MNRKYLFLGTLLLLSNFLLTGCESARYIPEVGKEIPCVGAFDDRRNPNFKYEPSARNVILAIIFGETIIVPVIVLLEVTMCPYAPTATQ